ncbi:DUF4097 family beta strand repeat-containing protein [Streptomyces sp. B-S-A8]|uniref:DUF4097 family beta strand repeat-containing protein n=1 Tax=Streptomyces solicavernae TaxID=3043614 RepID=A0ABT6RKK0_9ACTN|nr:DUF4097 family beta strand repeat-containing protein [Streptomyces sp. B-S-A8]MDI3384959.1 DUF4097 family beta strand repeat-containing protein [Streptomyces sp. B-S-A8]
MPTFDTPEPIALTLEFDLGAARIVAGARADTVVEVLPRNGADDHDVQAAQQTKVTFAGGRLLVRGPRKRSLFGRPGSLDITVELPAGSDLRGSSPMADLVCEGPLGHCEFKTSLGDLQVQRAATVRLRTSHGDLTLGRVDGAAEVTGAGRIEIGRLGAAATVRNGNGDTTVGEAVGDLKANAANGRISVDVAHAAVDAKAANGHIRVGDVARGRITLRTAAGDVEVGVRESTAAWLDVSTGVGTVLNSLGPAEGPGAAEETVEVRATTSAGDIVVRRA